MKYDFDLKEMILSIRDLKFEIKQIKKLTNIKDEDIHMEENEYGYIELDRTNLWKKFKMKRIKNKVLNVNRFLSLSSPKKDIKKTVDFN